MGVGFFAVAEGPGRRGEVGQVSIRPLGPVSLTALDPTEEARWTLLSDSLVV